MQDADVRVTFQRLSDFEGKLITIDGKRVDSRATVKAPPGRGEIEVQYAGLSLVDPQRVRFKYELEGFDRSWVDAGTRRVAYYTNIPPGRYVFRVAAANASPSP